MLPALIVGGAVFALFFVLLFPGRVFVGILGGLGGMLAGALIFTPAKKDLKAEVAEGITEGMLQEALRDGAQKLSRLRSYALRIRDQEVRKEADGIVDVVDRILTNIKNDPKDLRQARQFLTYYLDATITIMSRYVELTDRGADGSHRETLQKVEERLGTIRKAFENQLAKLMENDVMDLSVELDVLERTIKMEGLGDDQHG